MKYQILPVLLQSNTILFKTFSRVHIKAWNYKYLRILVPPYRITIWLIDDVKLVFIYLLDDLILGFCYSNLDTGNRWTRARIDYHPCITSESTNQVC